MQTACSPYELQYNLDYEGIIMGIRGNNGNNNKGNNGK